MFYKNLLVGKETKSALESEKQKEVLYSFRKKNDFIFRSFIEMFFTANISM